MSESRISYEKSAPSPYAGFWQRVGASLIDGLILMPVIFLLIWLFLSANPRYGQPIFSPGYYILTGFFVLAYRVCFESSRYQATPGKRVMGIMVTDLGGHTISVRAALIRSWIYWGGSVLAIIDILFGTTTPFGMGFFGILGYIAITSSCIMVAFTERMQGWHDIMAASLVVRKGAKFEPPPSGPPTPSSPVSRQLDW